MNLKLINPVVTTSKGGTVIIPITTFNNIVETINTQTQLIHELQSQVETLTKSVKANKSDVEGCRKDNKKIKTGVKSLAKSITQLGGI